MQPALPNVLFVMQIIEFRGDKATQRAFQAVAEGQARANQPLRVAKDDRAVRSPNLDLYDLLTEASQFYQLRQSLLRCGTEKWFGRQILNMGLDKPIHVERCGGRHVRDDTRFNAGGDPPTEHGHTDADDDRGHDCKLGSQAVFVPMRKKRNTEKTPSLGAIGSKF